ncbi:alpha/beta hydrolase [Naasia lichenicola]|uniref:Alpha/beta fold hydrolase n=1 Tax=Naasia lichenicola TaxID=2565933 RepID=A0A4S4FMQ1_9MICO|nr:alpha/beta hydrolase [Naasia lichenicola]THG31709.1 alpha/beta fold hydrolase [Naasia lichenicola]
MRALLPDESGAVDRDGVSIGYDVYGDADAPAIVLLPTWAIADAMHWKAQIPVLARRFRVITVDGRGTRRSDGPAEAAGYTLQQHADDVLAVLDATGTAHAAIAGVSIGGVLACLLAAVSPDRVTGAILIAPALWSLSPADPPRQVYSFVDVEADRDGWATYNQHVWRNDLPSFAEFFWGRIFSEPHSTKQIEDGVGWTLATGAETLVSTQFAAEPIFDDADRTAALLRSIRCPVLVVQGSDDEISPPRRSEIAAELTRADLLVLEGGGHCPQARDPIRVNQAILAFLDRVTPAADRRPVRTTWTRGLARPPRVLYLSSPIGLGHARRDLAIARGLRQLRPDVELDWLAQAPVTTFLGAAAERIHSASDHLASESAHLQSEAHEHDLNAFQAIRRMDEILVANFSVFQDVVDSGAYDLVVGDEAWDVDHFWHENPELKRSAFVWMTDFVGWLPAPGTDEREAALTADYNAEMIAHVERFGRQRDRSIFIGDREDIVPQSFGPGLPDIGEWTSRHFEFSGYVSGFEPPDHAEARARLGYPVDVPVVIVTVGGSGVGRALLTRIIAAFPAMRRQISDLRLMVVAGPRIDPSSLPGHDGIEIVGYLDDLPTHLAACDAAIVQGGLTTTMELVACRRPFLYFPLGQHFEQQLHVRHRLDRYRAGSCLDFATSTPDSIADALVSALATPVDYRAVGTDGAMRAARSIAEIL